MNCTDIIANVACNPLFLAKLKGKLLKLPPKRMEKLSADYDEDKFLQIISSRTLSQHDNSACPSC